MSAGIALITCVDSVCITALLVMLLSCISANKWIDTMMANRQARRMKIYEIELARIKRGDVERGYHMEIK